MNGYGDRRYRSIRAYPSANSIRGMLQTTSHHIIIYTPRKVIVRFEFIGPMTFRLDRIKICVYPIVHNSLLFQVLWIIGPIQTTGSDR